MATYTFFTRLRRIGLAGLGALAVFAGSFPALAHAQADELLRAARTAVQARNWTTLADLSAQLQQHPLAAYPDYWRLSWMLSRKDELPPEAELRAFIQQHADSYLAERLKNDWLLAAARQRDYNAVLGLQDNQALTPQSRCGILSARLSRGETVDPEQALSTFRTGDTCWQMVGDLVATDVLTAVHLAAPFRDALELNNLKLAQQWGGYLFARPQQKMLSAALDQPMRWLAQQSQVPQDPVERFILTVALSRLSRSGDPAAGYTYFERNWANRLPLADTLWIRNQYALTEALRLSSQATTLYQMGEGAELTDYNHAWRVRTTLRQQPTDWAAVARYIALMPASLQAEPAWQFWRARSLIEQGQPDAAHPILSALATQFHFYGQLAAETLGQKIAVPAPTPIPDPSIARISSHPGLQRALELFKLNWRTEAVREWNYALRGMDDQQLLAAAHLAHRHQIFDRAINTAELTERQHDFRLRFIAPFYDDMVPKARVAGIEPSWAYGLIRQESRFVMTARSNVGASGLMQVMPATAQWVAKRIGMRDYSRSKLNDFDTNLTLGTQYLRIVQEGLEGSLLLASAGYNAGPGRPRTWRTTLQEPMEGAIFAETIPFTETRNYVQKVLSNATYYENLFTGQPQSLKHRLGTVYPSPVETADATP